MVMVVKLGGGQIDTPDKVKGIASGVKRLIKNGQELVVVHGGGKDIDAALARAGMAPKKVDGLRVTDLETLKVVSYVLQEKNRELVEALKLEGLEAVGIHAGTVLYVQLHMPVFSEGGMVHLGFVGSVVGHSVAGIAHLKKIISSGAIPVIHPVYISEKSTLNVNADEVCGAIAGALKADRVIYLSDVPGIYCDNGSVLKEVRANKMASIDKYVQGGMIPKVSACILALDSGAKETVITNVLSKDPHGTRITR
jgi:acetylglutamate kinase